MQLIKDRLLKDAALVHVLLLLAVALTFLIIQFVVDNEGESVYELEFDCHGM